MHGTGCFPSRPRKIATLCVFKRCNLPNPAAEQTISLSLPTYMDGSEPSFGSLQGHTTYRIGVMCYTALPHRENPDPSSRLRAKKTREHSAFPRLSLLRQCRILTPPQGVNQHCNPKIHTALQCSLETIQFKEKRYLWNRKSNATSSGISVRFRRTAAVIPRKRISFPGTTRLPSWTSGNGRPITSPARGSL